MNTEANNVYSDTMKSHLSFYNHLYSSYPLRLVNISRDLVGLSALLHEPGQWLPRNERRAYNVSWLLGVVAWIDRFLTYSDGIHFVSSPTIISRDYTRCRPLKLLVNDSIHTFF